MSDGITLWLPEGLYKVTQEFQIAMWGNQFIEAYIKYDPHVSPTVARHKAIKVVYLNPHQICYMENVRRYDW